MTYIPHTDKDRRDMLKVLGVDRIDDLMSDIPEEVKLKGDLPLPPALSQEEVERKIGRIARDCLGGALADAFLGGGIYDHYIPPLVAGTLSRPEFYSAYTPYQAEVSQGSLQATFEFQSLLCRLTDMPLANASMYDGATAFAEGIWMAAAEAKGKSRVLVSETLHPRYRKVLETHIGSGPLTIVTVPMDKSGRTDQVALEAMIDSNTAVVAVQNPNYFGHIEELTSIGEMAHQGGAFFLEVFEPLSLAVLQTPGEAGVDIAVGEGQTLGCTMSYGGPLLGLFTCTERFLRKMPGRLAGLTEDSEGTRAFTLALQTREQHIRRGKATSNICTNQALLSVAALVHLASLGPQGLRQAALLTQERALLLRHELEKGGASFPFDTPFFREFAVRLPDGAYRDLREGGIIPGIPLAPDYPEYQDAYLVAVTERKTRPEIMRYADRVRDYLRTRSRETHAESGTV